MPYSFSHCAARYEDSRQLDRCPSERLLRKLSDFGVGLDSVVDFGTGTGFWLGAMARMGRAGGPNYAIDISPEMLEKARERVRNATFVLGGIEELANLDIRGADCIFLCMVAHLLMFPSDIDRLLRIAREKKVRHVVIVEEVSFFYHAFVGNPHYIELLPNGIRNAVSMYLRLRRQYGCPEMSEDRSAPFPMPSLSRGAWNSLNVAIDGYRFETPADIGWTWLLSQADVVNEIRNRGYSVCFCHDVGMANRIADDIEDAIKDGDYETKHEIPFWFNVHVFSI